MTSNKTHGFPATLLIKPYQTIGISPSELGITIREQRTPRKQKHYNDIMNVREMSWLSFDYIIGFFCEQTEMVNKTWNVYQSKLVGFNYSTIKFWDLPQPIAM